MDRINVLFLTAHLGNGGAERVYATLLKHLDRSQFQPKLLLLDRVKNEQVTQDDYLYDLPEDVEVFDYKASHNLITMVWWFVRFIKNEQPHIILTNTIATSFLVLIASFFISKSIKIVIKIGNVTSRVMKGSWKYHFARLLIQKSRFRRCSAVICLSRSVAHDFLSCFPIPKDKVHIIYNPVDIDQITQSITTQSSLQTKPLFRKDTYKLLAVGRLNSQKNFSVLLQVVRQLGIKNIHLIILGRGKEESMLKALTKQLNLSEVITFAGFKCNPYQYMDQADLLVMTSQYEGLGNVILEANTCGTPVVAFNCPGGVGEIIENGINGFLVDNQNQLAMVEAIQQAAEKQWEKEKIKGGVTQYQVSHICKQYEHLLQAI